MRYKRTITAMKDTLEGTYIIIQSVMIIIILRNRYRIFMKAERKILSIRKITFVQSVSLYTDFKIKIYISTYIYIYIYIYLYQ